MTELNDLGGQADALREEVARLRGEVEGLREDNGLMRDRIGAAEGRLWRTAAAAVVAVALAVGLGITTYRLQATAARIDSLCPVWALVVGGADPSTRPAGPAREVYVRAMQVMRTSYDDLGCRDIAPLVPPRSDR